MVKRCEEQSGDDTPFLKLIVHRRRGQDLLLKVDTLQLLVDLGRIDRIIEFLNCYFTPLSSQGAYFSRNSGLGFFVSRVPLRSDSLWDCLETIAVDSLRAPVPFSAESYKLRVIIDLVSLVLNETSRSTSVAG